MMNRLMGVLTLFVVVVGLCDAVPVRPPAAGDPPRAPRERPFDLKGTHYKGKDFVENYWIIFEPDGTMTYGYDGNTWRGGTWVQMGDTLYFEVNNKYREFKGTANPQYVKGESWNVTGKRWETYLLRVK